jgi:hypothetical protein
MGPLCDPISNVAETQEAAVSCNQAGIPQSKSQVRACVGGQGILHSRVTRNASRRGTPTRQDMLQGWTAYSRRWGWGWEGGAR